MFEDSEIVNSRILLKLNQTINVSRTKSGVNLTVNEEDIIKEEPSFIA